MTAAGLDQDVKSRANRCPVWHPYAVSSDNVLPLYFDIFERTKSVYATDSEQLAQVALPSIDLPSSDSTLILTPGPDQCGCIWDLSCPPPRTSVCHGRQFLVAPILRKQSHENQRETKKVSVDLVLHVRSVGRMWRQASPALPSPLLSSSPSSFSSFSPSSQVNSQKYLPQSTGWVSSRDWDPRDRGDRGDGREA